MSERFKKVCIMCRHFEFDSGWCGTYVTPGEPSSIGCSQNMFDGEWAMRMFTQTGTYRKLLLRADTCPKFEIHPECEHEEEEKGGAL